MAVKKVESFNIHETPAINQNMFDVETYLNANWKKTKEAVNNNAEELMQVQKDISTLKEDNKTNKSSIDVLEKSNETRDGKISKNAEDIEAIQGSIKTAIETINKKDNEQDEDIKANKESIKEIQAENERLRNDIKSIALQGEASGENIHLEDSSNARCEIEICGNQQQDVRIGKNRINLGLLGSGTLNGVTYTYNESNQSITFNGTCTKDNTRFVINDNANIQTIAKKTTFTAQYLAGSVSNYFTARIANNEWKHNLLLSLLTLNSSNNKVSLTETEDMVGVHIDIKANNGTILNNFTIQLMLTDKVDTDYEMYGASPSIDYPSPVKSVGDNVNYFDINSVTNTLIILESGNLYPNDSWRTTDFIEVKANIYTLSWESITDYFQCNIAFYDKDKKILSYIKYANRTFSNTFDVKNNAKYMRISYSVKSGVTSYTREKIKLETGNKRTEYSSYNCGSAKIDIFNKNYLSKIPKTSVTAQGITSTFDGEKFICKGTAQTNYFNLFTEKVYKKISKGIKTFSTNKLKKGRAFIHFDYVDGTDQNYYTSINTNQVSFTLNKDVESYRLNVDSITAGDTIDDNIYVQLEDGRIVAEIEKAENQEYLVDVQQEMLEGDYLDLENEKEHHEWGKYIFTGDEDYNKSQTYSNEKYFCGYIPSPVVTNIKLDKKGLCNCFRRFGDFTKILDEECIRIWGQFQVRILASHLTENSAEAFKTWLKSKYDEGNPVVVYYQLETPIELDFTNRQKLIAKQIKSEAHTYKNITNISAESAEINPIVNVKYLKDTETEHNKLQAQINEIKQLLSTTETSALLVNNLEKDLRMEVE